MQNCDLLAPFGIAIILLTAGLIVIPYLRGKTDVVTAWNLFLVGGAMFVGVGSLEVVYGNWHWPELQWFQPTQKDVNQFLIGYVAFYATLLVTYYFAKWPRAIAAKCFRKPYPDSGGSTFFFLALFLGLMLCTFLFQNVPIANALFTNVGHKAAVFASVISFAFWFRNKLNVASLGLFLGVFCYAVLFAMVVFVGRRLLLSIVIAPLISVYWLKWRYGSPKLNLIYLGIAAFLALSVAAVYSTFRHAGMSHGQDRSFSAIVQRLQSANLASAMDQVTNDTLHYVAQYTSHYSLLTIHLINSGEVGVQPLNSLAFLATYPVPRMLFPKKPEPMGMRIVSQVLRLPYQTNWGLGMVGHGYQEGGIPVIMLYAVLIVVLIRMLDDSLVRTPNNVFLLGILSTSAPHFISLMRGDTMTMSAEILESYFFAWGCLVMGRFLFQPRANPVSMPRSGMSAQTIVTARPRSS